MVDNEFLRLLGLIIDKLCDKNDTELDFTEELLKYLELSGYKDADIDKAIKTIRKLINPENEEKDNYYCSENFTEGIRILSPEEIYLYQQGSLKRLLNLKEKYFIENEIVEEIIDILIGLSSDEDIINEGFVDSLLHTILLDCNNFEIIAGIYASRNKKCLPS